ncbi:MFS transporter [Saccharothrix syringae]|uniref:MFS transporter n=1 Tax=Saccharothrix syringae TaxID=103733 RepID=A0A5Q0H5W7_SACSY|nr:MFS transporter [Saccharothrix syringae]
MLLSCQKTSPDGYLHGIGGVVVLEALRIRDFRLLWGARAVSSLGSWLLVVVVPAHVYRLSGGSVALAGAALAAEFLPPAVLGPVAGVLVDRWDRRRVMVAADLVRAGAVAGLLFVRAPGDLWLVYVALVVESTGTVLFRPAVQAHTPVVVGTGPSLSGANAVNSLTDGVARLVGAPLGGALLVPVGFPVLVVVDAVSHLVSAGLVALVSTGAAGAPGTGGGMAEGLRFLRSERTVWVLLRASTVFLAANAALGALLVPFGMAELGGPGAVGLVMSGLGAGFLLGVPPTRHLVDRVRVGPLVAGALVVTSAGFALLFAPTAPVVAAVVVGCAGSAVLVGVQTAVQRATPAPLLGRVGSVLFAGEAVATFAGALAGPALAGVASVRVVAWGACGVTLLSAVLAVGAGTPVAGSGPRRGRSAGRSPRPAPRRARWWRGRRRRARRAAGARRGTGGPRPPCPAGSRPARVRRLPGRTPGPPAPGPSRAGRRW